MLALAPVVAVGQQSSSVPLSTAGPLLEEYGKRLQDKSLSEAERLQLVGLLGLWPGDAVRAPLIAVLDDPIDSVRVAAARALGWKGNAEAVPILRAHFEAPSEKPAMRAAALEALGKIGDESSRAVLLAATKDPNGALRGAAYYGLTFENLTNAEDRLPLLRQMAADRGIDPYIRCQAILTIGTLRDAGSADVLINLLATEPTSPMPKATGAPDEREVMAIRYRQARDVKGITAKVVWLIEARSAIPYLMKTAEDPDDYFLRLTSLETLGAWRVHEAIPVFVRRLDDPFDHVRVTALWALADIGDKSVVDAVLPKLSDRIGTVRAQAVDTLADLGDPRVRPQLLAMQEKETDGRVRDSLDKALTRLKQ